MRPCDAFNGLVLRQMLDGPKEFGVFLAHDPVQLRRPHPGVLHLLEGLAGVHALMLTGIADEEDAIRRPDLVEERPHLAGAGETGLIHHVQVAIAACVFVDATPRKEALQCVGGDARVPELTGSAAGRGEALDLIAATLRALADGLKGRGLPGPRKPLQPVDAVTSG